VEEVLLFNNFFSIVDTCLSCEDVARQNCAMVPRWRIFASFLRPVFSASRVQHVSDLHLNFMGGSVADIQSATAEIRHRAHILVNIFVFDLFIDLHVE